MQTNVKDVYFRYSALSPIFQSQPKTKDMPASKGNESDQRAMVFLLDNEGTGSKEKTILPIISGNSRRAIARRAFIQEILRRLDLMKGWKYSKDVKSDVFLALLSGGNMNKGSSLNPNIDAFIDVYNRLPFFGLFGGAFDSVFFQGRISCGIAIPVTPGTLKLFIKEGSPYDFSTEMLPCTAADMVNNDNTLGYVRFQIKGLVPEGEMDRFIAAFLHYPDMLQALQLDMAENEKPSALPNFVAYLGTDEEATKEVGQYFGGTKNKPLTIKDIESKVKGQKTTQMLYFINQPIPAGTELHAHDYLMPGYGDDDLMEACWHAYLETMKNRPYIGAMAAKGYGTVAIELRTKDGAQFESISRANEFWAWLEENKATIREDLVNFRNILFPVK